MSSDLNKSSIPSRVTKLVTLLAALALAGVFIAGALAAVGHSTPRTKARQSRAPIWRISGNVVPGLYPGMKPTAMTLSLSNPNKYRLSVSRLTVTVGSVTAPSATRAEPCTKADFAVSNYTGHGFTVPHGLSTLTRDHVPQKQWPTVSMLARPVNQEGCEGATVNLLYRGIASKVAGLTATRRTGLIGAGSASVGISILSPPKLPLASASAGNVELRWAASTIGGVRVAASSYTVERYDGSGNNLGPASCGTVSSSEGSGGAFGGFSCTDSPGSGMFEYKITAHYRTWTATTGFTNPVSFSSSRASVVSSANPSESGQRVTYTATVAVAPAGTPTGNVEFLDGTQPITGCTEPLTGTGPFHASCQVTYSAVGSHAITVTYLGDGVYPSATSTALTEMITEGNQTIVFEELANERFDQGPLHVAATASSGLPVSFSSVTAGVCTVSGSTVSFLAVGTCTIKADQAGDSNWNAAPSVSQSFTVTKGDQTIIFEALASKGFDQGPLHVAATASSNLPVSFSSTTTGVCTVSGATVSFLAVGTCTIKADQAGDSNWNAAPSVSQSFTITKDNQTIIFEALASKSFDQGPITVAASASSGLPVSFSSTTTGVCTVSATTVSFVAPGTCTIKADQAGDSNWNAAPSVSQSFTVTPAAGTLTALSPAFVEAEGGAARVVVSPDGKNVYATNRGTTTVSQYSRNAETGTLTPMSPATVAAGESPEGIVVSPDGKNVYVSNRESKTVSQYERDPETGNLIPLSPATVPAGEGSVGIAISPDGKSVYAADSLSEMVSQYSRNTQTGVLTALSPATVQAGTSPHGIVVSPDGKNVYATNYGSGTVSQYARNAKTGVLSALSPATVNAASNPHDLAVSPDGKNIYVANSNATGTVSQFTRSGSGTLTAMSTEAVTAGESTECVAVSPDGNSVYATNLGSGNVSAYARNSETGELTALSLAPTIAAGSEPEGIAVSPEGDSVYAANFGSGTVSQYSRVP